MFNSFHESIHYEPVRDRMVRRGPVGPTISFSNRDIRARDRIMAYFDTLSPHHVGILHGEYIALACGGLLMDRKGALHVSSMHLDHPPSAHALWENVQKPDIRTALRDLLDTWDRFDAEPGVPVISDSCIENYFHFSTEMVPLLRHFIDDGPCALPRARFLIPLGAVAKQFQRDLLSRAARGIEMRVLARAMRVRDPVLAEEQVSAEGIQWLRRANAILARPGPRRLYLRRSPHSTRGGGRGNLCETDGFLALLRDYGFETLSFGDGELGVAEQIALLDGGGVILAAQGAGLANLAYLDPQVTVIEIIGAATRSAACMFIANAVGMTYHGLYSATVDTGGNIVVDLDELRDVLRLRVPVHA